MGIVSHFLTLFLFFFSSFCQVVSYCCSRSQAGTKPFPVAMTVIRRPVRPLLVLALLYGQTVNICRGKMIVKIVALMIAINPLFQ